MILTQKIMKKLQSQVVLQAKELMNLLTLMKVKIVINVEKNNFIKFELLLEQTNKEDIDIIEINKTNTSGRKNNYNLKD